ncbi:uncharacterized protein LOC129781929 [Toxorhynchites rutilus septentrionalis]|uniref:uncharacterized protein LOC129765453 n=1 Tax=Toxorhynchites rutilus septentrionalis TaxID=329112 RepID=UPI00247A62C9|nr:uncharacterized protein LOC129765453 [Toxorhynchites rutilus septentrionalis]XP_055645402.1 uncharacterized protein LOC129781929 [Toxorhynchites rutilus septentrionalis]
MKKHTGTFLYLIISTFLTISYPQTIQISEITNNAGALILEKGEGRIIAGYSRILHIIELTQFEVSIKFIENVISILPNTNGPFSVLIKATLIDVKHLYNNLQPRNIRSKRSINFLGSVIKLVTGNLDANDLQIINSNMENLKTTEENLVKQNNNQLKINTRFEDRINFINDQFRSQHNLLKELSLQNNYLLTEDEKISIIFNLYTLFDILNSIENAIVLAKLNIVSRFILTQKELEMIAQEIQSDGLNIQNLDDAYSYLSPTVFYRGSSLIICANIPRLIPTHFKKLSVEPLPYNNRTIKINYKNVLQHDSTIFAIRTNCEEHNDVTLCERKQLTDISNDQCESRLIQGQTGK